MSDPSWCGPCRRPLARPPARRPAALLAAVLAALAVAACGGGGSEAELLASAKALAEKKDHPAAVVQLKNVLQRNPQSAEARFLLGRTLMKTGDFPAAVVELEKAQDLKYGDDEVLPELARALVATGQDKKVTELYGRVALKDARAAGELKAIVATAWVAQGLRERGEAALGAALQFDPKNVSARLLQARLTGARGEVDPALAQVRGLLVDEPQRREAHYLEGELLWAGKRDLDGALKAFRQTLTLDPRYLPAHGAVMTLLLQKRDIAGFREQLEVLRKQLPSHPETRFYEVQLALIDGDLARAREGAQQLLRVAPDNARALQLAGAVEFQAGVLLMAETHLNKALRQNTNLPLARRLLAETGLRAGQPAKALGVLLPLLDPGPAGADTLALAAEAHLQNGDTARAEDFFNRAAQAAPADARIRTAVALTQLAKGNVQGGFAMLESAAQADAGTYADLALVSARMRRAQWDEALKAVDRLQAKTPDKPLPALLRGRILGQRGDGAGARAAFERALAIDAVYFPAVAALAALDVADKQPDAARQRYEKLLEREPKNYRALLAVAELRQAAGAKPEETRALLEGAVKANPGEAAPRVMLVEHLLARRDAKAARDVAQQADAALPDNAPVLDALGRAQLAAGDVQQALSTFRKAAALQPGVPQPLLRLADAHIVQKDYVSATQVLRRVIETSPQLLVAQRGLVQVSLADRKPEQALQVVRDIQKQRPREAVGWLLEADVQASQKRWDEAVAATDAALARQPGTEMAIRTHAMRALAGRAADAERFADRWIAANPRDGRFIFQVAAVATARADHARAEMRLRQFLSQAPDNALALNNLAVALVAQGKPGAVAAAERAQKALPDNAAVMDTLASALAAEKRWPQALEWQRKALVRDPESPTLRLHLAQLLVRSGDRDAARTELQALAQLGDKFPAQPEVAALMKEVQ